MNSLFKISTLAILAFSYIYTEQPAITYHVAGIERFGDLTLKYCKAKWLALENNLELLFVPYIYSNQLAMHQLETHYNPQKAKAFETRKDAKHENDIDNKQSTLFNASLFAYLPSVSNNSLSHSSRPGDTNINDICEETLTNHQFGRELKKMLQPIVKLPHLNLPDNMITVAIHVRKGGGYDKPIFSKQLYKRTKNMPAQPSHRNFRFIDTIHPFKFPPNQFYIDQLKLLSSLLDDAPMYVFIFTDDQSPRQLIEIFKKECNKPNITFDCREYGNFHNKNIVEDLWAMAQFDCLIRGWSHFPGIAQIIGDHKIIIYPLTCFWSDDTLIMDEIFIIVRNIKENELLTFKLPHDTPTFIKQTIRTLYNYS